MNDSEKAFAKWWAAYLPDDSVKSSTDIHRAAWDAATERAVRELERRASLYQLPDGEPGVLASLWGWRIIAKELWEAADRIRGGTT